MAFEDPEDLDGFFDPEEFGVEARYRADNLGDGVLIPVMYSSGDQLADVLGGSILADNLQITLPIHLLPGLKEGDSFEIDGVVMVLDEDPRKTKTSSLWQALLAKADE